MVFELCFFSASALQNIDVPWASFLEKNFLRIILPAQFHIMGHGWSFQAQYIFYQHLSRFRIDTFDFFFIWKFFCLSPCIYDMIILTFDIQKTIYISNITLFTMTYFYLFIFLTFEVFYLYIYVAYNVILYNLFYNKMLTFTFSFIMSKKNQAVRRP